MGLTVTKSAQKAEKSKWILSLIPVTPVLTAGGRTASEVFASIGHDNNALLCKTFKQKKDFCGPFYVWGCVCVCVRTRSRFKLVVLKISTF